MEAGPGGRAGGPGHLGAGRTGMGAVQGLPSTGQDSEGLPHPPHLHPCQPRGSPSGALEPEFPCEQASAYHCPALSPASLTPATCPLLGPQALLCLRPDLPLPLVGPPCPPLSPGPVSASLTPPDGLLGLSFPHHETGEWSICLTGRPGGGTGGSPPASQMPRPPGSI